MRLPHAHNFRIYSIFDSHPYQLAAIVLMRASFIVWVVIVEFLFLLPVSAQGSSAPAITAPAAGQTLQGQVSVSGTSDIPNFASAELSFSYSGDPTGTWFVIQSNNQPVSNAPLGAWDTTAISDGEYTLRLRVMLQDGTYQDATVTGLRVMNYTSLPTATPTSTASPTAALPIPTPILLLPSPSPTAVTPTTAPLPTPTPLEVNPAELTPSEIYVSLQRGALVIAGIFIVFGILLRLRRS